MIVDHYGQSLVRNSPEEWFLTPRDTVNTKLSPLEFAGFLKRVWRAYPHSWYSFMCWKYTDSFWNLGFPPCFFWIFLLDENQKFKAICENNRCIIDYTDKVACRYLTLLQAVLGEINLQYCLFAIVYAIVLLRGKEIRASIS